MLMLEYVAAHIFYLLSAIVALLVLARILIGIGVAVRLMRARHATDTDIDWEDGSP